MSGSGSKMRSVEQHLEAVLARIRPLPPFDQHLLDAHGHRLAEDVISPRDVPLFDNSAMDGYAVRRIDVVGADEESPAILTVTQELPAGSAVEAEIGPGACARIMTGAPIPPGADAVVPVEWTSRTVSLCWPLEPCSAPGRSACSRRSAGTSSQSGPAHAS
jgi:molybdopterin molybdotransferase